MAKQGWQKGQGPFSEVSDGKDRIRQGDYKDTVRGNPRQLDHDKLEKVSDGRGKLPKSA